ncbi:hypothetical protein RND71_024597 [Anisodus tanguticus]|uniref:Uncharacterized protein n=1 Tax=Anisodus tanguticus TaxID=243964 RepID=A0AAE1RRD9_9SOLA|nr:hypothetical protein RND71_024597 [Anisodus tanguticus]
MAMRAGREGGINNNVVINGLSLVCPYMLVPLENIEQGISYKSWITIGPPSEVGLHSPIINPLAEKAPCLSGLGCSRVLLCMVEKDEYIPREFGIQFVEGVKKSVWKGNWSSFPPPPYSKSCLNLGRMLGEEGRKSIFPAN